MSLPPISRRIIEYAGTDLPSSRDGTAYLQVLKFAQLAWNYSILPAGSEASEAIVIGLLRMPAEERSSIQQKLTDWVARKKRMFPDDRRIIVHVEIEDHGDRFNVNAASYNYDNPRTQPADPVIAARHEGRARDSRKAP